MYKLHTQCQMLFTHVYDVLPTFHVHLITIYLQQEVLPQLNPHYQLLFDHQLLEIQFHTCHHMCHLYFFETGFLALVHSY